MIADNIKQIQNTITKYKQVEDVTFVAVTKTRSIEDIKEVVATGVVDLGENRVQELLEKYPHFDKNIRWHLIGTLQKNKVKYIIDKVHLIHSVDSISLLEEINSQAKKNGICMNVLLQLNISKEESKHGFYEENIVEAIQTASNFENIKVVGLMTMAPDTEDVAIIRNIFKKIRNIFDDLMQISEKYGNIEMCILSMGMSNDFELALKEKSNLIRVGRIIYK